MEHPLDFQGGGAHNNNGYIDSLFIYKVLLYARHCGKLWSTNPQNSPRKQALWSPFTDEDFFPAPSLSSSWVLHSSCTPGLILSTLCICLDRLGLPRLCLNSLSSPCPCSLQLAQMRRAGTSFCSDKNSVTKAPGLSAESPPNWTFKKANLTVSCSWLKSASFFLKIRFKIPSMTCKIPQDTIDSNLSNSLSPTCTPPATTSPECLLYLPARLNHLHVPNVLHSPLPRGICISSISWNSCLPFPPRPPMLIFSILYESV